MERRMLRKLLRSDEVAMPLAWETRARARSLSLEVIFD
jgi:hypothetical protein